MYQRLLLTITSSLWKESIFAALTLLFQQLCSSPWHAVNQLLGHILTDGSQFLHNQCFEFVRICGVLFVHPAGFFAALPDTTPSSKSLCFFKIKLIFIAKRDFLQLTEIHLITLHNIQYIPIHTFIHANCHHEHWSSRLCKNQYLCHFQKPLATAVFI